MKNKKLTIVLIIVLLLAVCIPVATALVAYADSSQNATVIVHFYNGEGKDSYENLEFGGRSEVSWGAYYWIDVGRIVASDGLDTDFARDDNVGRSYTIKLNATETSAVKSGKKLGLIMVRAYIDDTNTYTPYWYGNKGKDLPSDRFLSVTLNANNVYEVWIIAGDKNNYTSLAEARTAFERIESARFDDFDKVLVQTTSPVTTSTGYKIYAKDDAFDESNGRLVKEGTISNTWDEGLKCELTCSDTAFDWHSDYMLWIDGYAFPTAIDKARLYLSSDFKSQCLPEDADNNGVVDVALGSHYSKSATTFRLWAPISTNVIINFYTSGDETDPSLSRSPVAMTKATKGVWEATVNADLANIYYTYVNYVAGEVHEINDPYATAVGINGNRAMVCDLDSTDPEGWDNDLTIAEQIRKDNSQTAVIWEIHIRDFSISADSGITYKGKYLAFTEDGTTTKGNDTFKTGLAYLKELGVTYVHLNPVYDFATVDEEYNNNIDYATAQNWGYDPKNYNVPDGSYSTNAEDGAVRINEFKRMVQALHNAGIGVIMDVVYNHTYTANSWFDQNVPGYYYRQELSGVDGTFGYQSWNVSALGTYNLSDGSGCSNELASEREMYRSYMINSVMYWVNEYHIDGFRFDLMGCHDTYTMYLIREALNKLPGGSGILIYGEPWAASVVGLDPATGLILANNDNAQYLADGIKIFNDTVRTAIKGSNDPGKGFVNGNTSVVETLLLGICGGPHDADQSVLYTTSHDNYTLWDQLVATTVGRTTPTLYSEGNSVVLRRNMMAAVMTLMGKGTSFILAGEEIARTKYGNHNSYNAQDKINAFDYYRQEQFSELFDWYKGLIELRTQRFTSVCRDDADIFCGAYAGSDTVYFGYNRTNAQDEYSKVMILCNAGSTSYSIPYDDSWTLIGNSKTGVFDFDSTVIVGNGNVVVPPYTTYILVQK